MEFNTIVKKRKSVRAFKKKKPDWRSVLEAIDLANQGPFAGNNNHLRFLIVEDDKIIDEIAALCEQKWIKQVKLVVLVCSDDTHLEALYGERGRIYGRQQAGAAIQTFLLALTNLGINSCWIGAYSDELVRGKLNIPQHIQIEAIVPLGFEDGNVKKPRKKELERTLYWESWENVKRPTIFREEAEDYRPGRLS